MKPGPENPYAPPTAPLETAPIHLEELASRGSRFGASPIDSLLGLLVGIPFAFYLGILDGFPKVEPLTLPQTAALVTQGWLTFLLLHGYLLYVDGQTIGKRALGIRITRPGGLRVDFARLMGLRYLPVSVTTLIPFAGQLIGTVDVLFIFSASRRCLHDRIADTIVVRVDDGAPP